MATDDVPPWGLRHIVGLRRLSQSFQPHPEGPLIAPWGCPRLDCIDERSGRSSVSPFAFAIPCGGLRGVQTQNANRTVIDREIGLQGSLDEDQHARLLAISRIRHSGRPRRFSGSGGIRPIVAGCGRQLKAVQA